MRGGKFGSRRKRHSGILSVFPILFILLFSGMSLATSAPTIIYSPGAMSIPPDTAYPINVTVIPSRDTSVVIHWTFSSSEVHNDSMTFVADDRWYGELPAQSDFGHFSYYITAEDASGGIGRYPRNGNLTVYVADMIPPIITFDNSTLPLFSAGKAVNLTVEAQDDNAISYVAFYYRYEGDIDWQTRSMENSSGNGYYLIFTPEHSGPMEFYFVASDGRNRAYFPSSGAASPMEVSVSSNGLFGLSLTITVLMLISVALAVVDIVFYFRRKRGHSSGRNKSASGQDGKRKEKED